MLFKCCVCNKYKLKNKYSYEIIATNNGKDVTSLWACRECGEGIDEVYNSNKKLMKMGEEAIENE